MIGYLSGYYPLTRPDSFLCKCRIRIRSSCSHFDLVLRKQRLFLPWSLSACLPGGGGPQIGEVTCVGVPYLTCKRDQIKMRDYMDRRVTSPKRVTLPTCGPLPPFKEAPNLSVHEILVVPFFLATGCTRFTRQLSRGGQKSQCAFRPLYCCCWRPEHRWIRR